MTGFQAESPDKENDRRILQREQNPNLFRPLVIREVSIKNRIMLSPMCQYSGNDGLINDWHFAHLAARAVGGAGIIFTEAVHTEPCGRITPYCLGLWNEHQCERLKRVADFVGKQGAVPAIQLGHAGRKASVNRPWEGTKPLSAADGGWEVVSASERPYAAGGPIPRAMSRERIIESLENFAGAVRLARKAGFQILEIHAAHGYLIHQFLSPLSNVREDEYGGTFENRIRFLLKTITAVRSEWPSQFPLFVRISATDWVQGGWTLRDSIRLGRVLKERREVDLIDCSSGGNDPRQKIPASPGYQVPFSAAIRKHTGLKTGAVGLIHSPDFAESILANQQADIIVLGRALLADPIWPLRAAAHLRATSVRWPVQYERANIYHL